MAASVALNAPRELAMLRRTILCKGTGAGLHVDQTEWQVTMLRMEAVGQRGLRKRWLTVREAWSTSKSEHGPWRLSKTPALNLALPAKLFRQMGLPELAPAKAAWDHTSIKELPET